MARGSMKTDSGLSGHFTGLFMKEFVICLPADGAEEIFQSATFVPVSQHEAKAWPAIKTILSHTNSLQFAATANEPVFTLTPVLLPSGKGAEQTRGVTTAHPEPFWNLPERQQERQLHPVGPLCGPVSGELLAAPAEQNQHTQGCI